MLMIIKPIFSKEVIIHQLKLNQCQKSKIILNYFQIYYIQNDVLLNVIHFQQIRQMNSQQIHHKYLIHINRLN